jgi:hypothetical protein
MTIILWIVGAALVVSIVVWRLRAASNKLSTILREERERTIIDAAIEATTEPAPKPQPRSRQHTAPPADQ